MNKAAQERALIQKRIDDQEAIIAAVAQTEAKPPDENEIAVARLAAASQQAERWMPVAVDVRGQKVIALVCKCGPVKPDDIWQTIRRLTRPLQKVG